MLTKIDPPNMCAYIYIYMVRLFLMPRFCLNSVIVSGNFALLANLGHQGRGVCHNSTIKNSGPKIAGRRSM